ncbi:hypothetical protein [Xanthomonas phage Suba]|uniref:Uncharacterized protein n=1 Tax=Xanthomonas phage Suba TaxID=2674975 RepID=A0A679KKI7_9CAUD|nr:hypothetical protein QAY88_gp35 [Xanthomonas phage Suba]CAA2409827.1 hypothetical protein [Xanthomonas phage Suba]
MKHGTDPGQGSEFTICGIAFDAHDSGDYDRTIEFAQPGEVITCPECRKVIAYFKSIKHWKEPI